MNQDKIQELITILELPMPADFDWDYEIMYARKSYGRFCGCAIGLYYHIKNLQQPWSHLVLQEYLDIPNEIFSRIFFSDGEKMATTVAQELKELL